ncbi:MAG: hypothetical protein WAN81_05470, partial [Candidatus Binataceae bacterium]
AIEALFKERIDDHLAKLAHHYSRTANTRKAAGICFAPGAIEEGFASVAKTGQQTSSRALHHVKAELLLAQNPSNAAEVELCFRTAIEIARGQSARMTELRVTTSLARLLAKQGPRDEARAMLADIYGRFTEGFDTADLKDAKALLDELNA